MNLPNKITIFRIACTPVMIALFLIDIPYGIGYFLATFIFIIGSLSDLVDGYIARKYNLVTDFGKFMDQIADKFIATAALVLVLFSEVVPFTWLAVLILLIVVLRDTLVGGIRQVAASKGVVIAADVYGKIKSLFIDISSTILMFYVGLRDVLMHGDETILFGDITIEIIAYFGLTLLLIGTVLTVFSCVNYLVKAIPVLKSKKEGDV